MTVKSEKIFVNTKGSYDIANITTQLNEVIVRNTLREGVVCISSLNSQAAIVRLNLNSKLKSFLPELLNSNFYRVEGLNLDANLKAEINSLLLDKSILIPVTNGKPQLELNEQVFLADLSAAAGQRSVLIQMIS